jgi:hypothetical protein
MCKRLARLHRYLTLTQVFVVDNSPSMEAYRDSIASLFGTLAYMVKTNDPNGLDLYFRMDPTHVGPVHDKDTSKLVREIERKKFHGNVDLSRMLRKILGEYEERLEKERGRGWFRSLIDMLLLSQTIRPMSVYIFTDETWSSSSFLHGLFVEVRETLSRVEAGEGQLRIQFIQFGEDHEGAQKLAQPSHAPTETKRYDIISKVYLNVSFPLTEPSRNIVDDIVDVEPYEGGNVWKMLLGSSTLAR